MTKRCIPACGVRYNPPNEEEDMAARELKVGDRAPSFRGEIAPEETISNGDFEGKNVVLFFYPKDSTSG